MSVRDRIANAKAANMGNNILPGKGVAIISKIVCEKMNEGETFVAEVLIESAVGYSGDGPDGKPYGPPSRPGSFASWVQKLDKHKSAEGQVKAFVLHLMEKTQAEVDAKEFTRTYALLVDHVVLDPKTLEETGKAKGEAAAGFRLTYETIRKEIQSKKGEWIDVVKWRPFPNTAATIKDGRAKLAAAAQVKSDAEPEPEAE